ncbi:MAG: hypothetical protein QM723_38730 [Myxococcaceae bacterium]
MARFFGSMAMIAVLGACGPAAEGEHARLRGKVSETDTSLLSQAQAVRAVELQADRSFRVIGVGTISNGRYEVVTEVTQRPVLLEATDLHGLMLARAVVEADLAPNAEVRVQPLDEQSSLQAAVLLQLERLGCLTSDLDQAGLRLRFDPQTTQRMKELAATDPLTASSQVRALAQAEWAGQLALNRFVASQGVGWNAWKKARADVLAELDQSLMSGQMSAEIAPARLQLAFDQIDAQFGLDPEIVAYRELRTVSASRSALIALSADTFAPAQAYLRVLAGGQARQSAASLNTLLSYGRAPTDVLQQAATVNAVLQRDVAAAQDETAVIDAFARWRDAVRGRVVNGQLSSGLLQTWLPDFAQADSMTGLLGQLSGFESNLDGQLGMVERMSLSRFDPKTVSNEVGDAWSSFDFEIDHAVQQVAPLNSDREAAVTSLLIHSQSSFR